MKCCDLPQLGDVLLRLVLLLGHSCILQMARKPHLREDHFSGGRPGPPHPLHGFGPCWGRPDPNPSPLASEWRPTGRQGAWIRLCVAGPLQLGTSVDDGFQTFSVVRASENTDQL
jgi:hypothetical protein